MKDVVAVGDAVIIRVMRPMGRVAALEDTMIITAGAAATRSTISMGTVADEAAVVDVVDFTACCTGCGPCA